MATITALNVRLGMDASNFSAGADLARNEVNRVASIMRQSVPPADKFKREVDLLNRAFSKSGKQSKAYANAIDHLAKKHQQGAHSVNAMTVATSSATSASGQLIGRIKGLVAAYVGLQTITKSIKLATEVEDAQVAFEVLTGSVNDGKVLFQQIRDFAQASPITFSNAAQATRTMMSFGVEAQRIQETLRMLSDITGGNNERFAILTRAFSGMSAAGRLMGEDVQQMIDAGFNPLQQISKMTGESLIELKKRMEAGAIASEEVRQALIAATAEGGMFHGMTERLAQTMGGQLNIAMSDLEKAGASLGQTLGPLIISMTDGFQQNKSILNDMIWLVEKLTDGLGFLTAGIKDNMDSLKSMLTLSPRLSFDNQNKFLNMIDKRNRERAAEQANQQAGALSAIKEQTAAIQAKTEAEKEAAKAAEAARKKQDADFWKDYDARVKAIEDTESAFTIEVESAMKAAQDFFDNERQKDDERRKEIAQGPASMEVGSAEAAKFMADQANTRLASMAVPATPTPGEKEIAEKTQELLVAQREANDKQQMELDTMKQLLVAFKENGFQVRRP